MLIVPLLLLRIIALIGHIHTPGQVQSGQGFAPVHGLDFVDVTTWWWFL